MAEVLLNSELGLVADAVSRVLALLPAHYESLKTQVELSVTEAVNNAIIHGNQSVADKQVCIQLSEKDGVLAVLVCDENPSLNADDLLRAEMPEGLASSGRGLALIRMLAPQSCVVDGCVSIRFERPS